jgi:RNA polymerase-binding transcription factor DksA
LIFSVAEHPSGPTSRLAAGRRDTEDRITGLTRQIAALGEQQALTTHDDEHDPEGVTIGFERAQLQGLLAGALRERAAFARAMARLADGTYGRCLQCGRPIPPERLEALPAAETCVACSSRRR